MRRTLTLIIYGIDRYETAVEISQKCWEGGSKNIVLATGEQFSDSLSAGPLAAKLKAPILLTGRAKLNSFTEKEIQRLKPQNIYIIGGNGAVSKGIESYLKTKKYTVTRISGANRYETSAKIAGCLGSVNEIFITSGMNYPDAISVTPVAAMKNVPIILADDNNISYLKSYLSQRSIKRSYIIGGKVLNSAPNPVRIFGDNRYDTNREVFKYFADDFNYETAYMTTGKNFPDALTGGILAGLSRSPILISDIDRSTSSENIIDSCRFNLKTIYVLGGNPVTDRDFKDITGITKNASTYLNIPTYEGSGQCNHPKVLYFSNGFRGYKYWMSNTPYPDGKSSYENPSVVVSNNGIDWTVPKRAKNPVVDWSNIIGEYNSDPNLVYNDKTSELEMWYRYSDNGITDTIYRVSTKDGVNWSIPEQLYKSNPNLRVLSPSIIFDDNRYKLWYITDINENSRIRYMESTDGHAWTYPADVWAGMAESYMPWHMDVTKIDGVYHYLISSFKYGESRLNNRVIFYGNSQYERSIGNMSLLLEPSIGDGWDDAQIYRPSLVYVNGIYKLYYSAMDKNMKWHIGLTQGRNLNDLYGLRFN